MKTGKMFKAHEERDQCMKDNESLDDAQSSYEMVIILRFKQILIFFDD